MSFSSLTFTKISLIMKFLYAEENNLYLLSKAFGDSSKLQDHQIKAES